MKTTTGLIAFAATLLVACGETATLPVAAGTGPSPQLPPPNKTLVPTVLIAPAVGWPQGGKPVAAAGTAVNEFAAGLDHPRWLHVLPNGDVLVAESNAPPKPEGDKGIKGFVTKLVMKRAGAGVPSANRITLLRDADGDGKAEVKTVFMQGLMSPFGMALVGDQLFIANADALVKVPYRSGQTQVTAAPTTVVTLPGGPINHHWTKNVIASRDGKKLYVTVGSNSNVGERGMAAEEGRAAIWEVDLGSGHHRLFATGIRNPNGMAWEPFERRVVDGRQRARRDRQRPGTRLPDLGARWRLLRLAVQLFRPACRCPGRAAAARSGRQGHRA